MYIAMYSIENFRAFNVRCFSNPQTFLTANFCRFTVCMYVCTYVCMYACMYVGMCMYVSMHVRMLCVSIYIRICM